MPNNKGSYSSRTSYSSRSSTSNSRSSTSNSRSSYSSRSSSSNSKSNTYKSTTYRGSNKWLYYTETDKLHPVKIPVTHKNKDCTDDHGCDEINDGDSVVIPSYNGDFKVKIYKMNKPRYIPYV